MTTDLALCRDDLCPSAGTCRRNVLLPEHEDEHQVYADFLRSPEEDRCDEFLEMEKAVCLFAVSLLLWI